MYSLQHANEERTNTKNNRNVLLANDFHKIQNSSPTYLIIDFSTHSLFHVLTFLIYLFKRKRSMRFCRLKMRPVFLDKLPEQRFFSLHQVHWFIVLRQISWKHSQWLHFLWRKQVNDQTYSSLFFIIFQLQVIFYVLYKVEILKKIKKMPYTHCLFPFK